MVGYDELLSTNESLAQENLHLRERTNSLAREVDRLKGQIEQFTKRLYGPQRERFENPAQLRFFDDAVLQQSVEESQEAKDEFIEVRSKRRKAKPKGPQPLPASLRRERVELDPDPEDRVCACCREGMARIGEKIFEELAVRPPEFFVLQYVCGLFRCEKCMNGSIQKPLPPRPIEHGRPSPSLLAYILVSKYVDHLPLYRQQQIFKRFGYELTRQTMDGWLGTLADLLRPIVGAIERQLLANEYLQIDETTMRYLADEKKGKSQQGYLWGYTRPREEIVYRFTTGRAAKHPKQFLASFRGKLQCDGYIVYDLIAKQDGVSLLACLAHIRRGFYDARYALPKEVNEILTLIRNLYLIDRARDVLDAEAFRAMRESASQLVAAELRKKIDTIAAAVLPKSKLGDAVKYALNQWSQFEATLASPEARLDNNWIENAMRPAALGRKNWLQLGSAEGGGKRIEVFLSLAQSCRRLGANPFDYFADVIERISTHPQAKIDELTPRGWMRARGIPLAEERTEAADG